MDSPRILPCGDSALSVEFGKTIDPLINQKVQILYKRIKADPPPGLIDLIPTYRSLLIQYDPLKLSFETLKQRVFSFVGLPEGRADIGGRKMEIPVCYGKEFGPDLEEVASLHQMTVDEVISLHTASTYQVYLIGFTPGFPYMGGLDERLFTPRKTTPRESVPAGTVGIAGQQTGIYPLESPGGWQLIGRTPVRIFDLTKADPFYLRPGDQVTFKAISEQEFENY
jgi:KipI family sensor histidine kinase inhibitor